MPRGMDRLPGYLQIVLRLCSGAKWWHENAAMISPSSQDNNDAAAKVNTGRWTWRAWGLDFYWAHSIREIGQHGPTCRFQAMASALTCRETTRKAPLTEEHCQEGVMGPGWAIHQLRQCGCSRACCRVF